MKEAIRISDAKAMGVRFIGNEYSCIDSWNFGKTKLLLLHTDIFHLYQGWPPFQYIGPTPIAASWEPRWSRTQPDILYFVRGNKVEYWNAASGYAEILHTFTEYRSVSSMGECDLSEDGDHLALCSNGVDVFLFDVNRQTRGEILREVGGDIDALMVTPDNNVLISWRSAGSDRFEGIELFDRDMRFLRQVARANGHRDCCRDENADEVLVWTNSAENPPTLPDCPNGIVKVRLADGHQTPMLSLDWTIAVHVSTPDLRGFAIVSTFQPRAKPDVPRANEILKVSLDGSGAETICRHESSVSSYTSQPRATVSRDGKYCAFSSNGGDAEDDFCNAYFVGIP